MRFEKWQGLGNHFVVLEALPEGLDAATVCDPHRGIGADGILLLDAEAVAMTVLNADGSRPEMCGNGLRIAACWFAGRSVSLAGGIRTDSGVMAVGAVSEASAEVVVAALPPAPERFEFDGHTGYSLDLGNPHALFFDPGASFDLVEVGRALQADRRFPGGVNVHRVRLDETGIEVTPFERGAGLTQACGTGAAAAAWCAHSEGWRALPLAVRLPGGTLTITGRAEALWMTGPAAKVFDGVWAG
jgi:diaminopimelate epimerase